MAMVRIASLAAICAVAFVESAYAGVSVGVPGPIVGAGLPGLVLIGAYFLGRKFFGRKN